MIDDKQNKYTRKNLLSALGSLNIFECDNKPIISRIYSLIQDYAEKKLSYQEYEKVILNLEA